MCAGVQRCIGGADCCADLKISRGAGVQRCRGGAEVQRCSFAVVLRCRGPEVQVQWCRGAVVLSWLKRC